MNHLLMTMFITKIPLPDRHSNQNLFELTSNLTSNHPNRHVRPASTQHKQCRQADNRRFHAGHVKQHDVAFMCAASNQSRGRPGSTTQLLGKREVPRLAVSPS